MSTGLRPVVTNGKDAIVMFVSGTEVHLHVRKCGIFLQTALPYQVTTGERQHHSRRQRKATPHNRTKWGSNPPRRGRTQHHPKEGEENSTTQRRKRPSNTAKRH